MLYCVENENNNNDNRSVSCITSQNKKYVFSDLFVQSSTVLGLLKADNYPTAPFDFPYSRNALKKIHSDLKIYHWVNPTSIEKCIIAHQLEISLYKDFLIETLWSNDRDQLFSLNPFRMAVLNAILRSNTANLLNYSLQIKKLKKLEFKKFNEKVYITSEGVVFKPVEHPATAQFVLQKYTVDSKGCKLIRFPLHYYFDREYYSLDYFLSLNKYHFLVIEQSSLENVQYIHLFDSDDYVISVLAPYCDKVKCEYDKKRKYFYLLSAKPKISSKAYELTLQRYDFSGSTEKIIDISHIKPQVLLRQYHSPNTLNEKSYEFFVDLCDGNAYLDYESEKMWHVFIFYPQVAHGMYHVFELVPWISAINANSLIHFYQSNNLKVEAYNLAANQWSFISEIPILKATDVFISQHAKFVLLREKDDNMFTDYMYDVQSGGLLYDFSFKNQPHSTEFRGDSFLLMKFSNKDGVRKQYVLISLRHLDEHVKYAQQLTVQEIINYCKNSRLEKLRH